MVKVSFVCGEETICGSFYPDMSFVPLPGQSVSLVCGGVQDDWYMVTGLRYYYYIDDCVVRHPAALVAEVVVVLESI